MYTIIDTISKYPWTILCLRLPNGEEKYWCMWTDHFEEEFPEAYRAVPQMNIKIDKLPKRGSWIKKSEINKI